MIHRRSIANILIAAVCLTLAGCSANAGWQYTPGPATPAGKNLPISLAVQRFEDQRPTSNERHFWVCMIPLVPYCTADYQRPDTANGFLTAASYNFRPDQDLAQA